MTKGKRAARLLTDVMPVNAIVVEVVEDGQAVLVGAALLEFAVVGLRNADAAILRPIVLATIGGGCQLLQLSGPEPSVDRDRLQVGAIASLEVTESAAGPDVLLLQNRKRKVEMCEMPTMMIEARSIWY